MSDYHQSIAFFRPIFLRKRGVAVVVVVTVLHFCVCEQY
jgi:hypothetical protein